MKAIIQIMLIALGTLFNMVGERSLEERFSTQGKEVLELDLKFADEIRLTTWNKNEVLVKVRVNINDNEDNDHFTLQTEESGTTLRIIEEIDDMEKLAKNNYVIKKDKDGETGVSCNSVKMDIFYEIMMPESLELKMESISADLIVQNLAKKSKIKTISGFIDYMISPNANADFEMATISGEMFTNLDLEIAGESDKFMHFGGQEVEARLNGGGKEIHLKTISGNIYLRAKK